MIIIVTISLLALLMVKVKALSRFNQLNQSSVVFAQDSSDDDDSGGGDDGDEDSIFIFDSGGSGGNSCVPENSWQILAVGCDKKGNTYTIRLNDCTHIIEPYYNPQKIAGFCEIPKQGNACDFDSNYNQFRSCAENCGAAYFACDSDPNVVRKYFDGEGGTCSQEQNNDACIVKPDQDEPEDPSPSPSPSPSESPSPLPSNSASPSASYNPNPSTDPSSLPKVTDLQASIGDKPVDIGKDGVKEGVEVTFTAILQSATKDYYCLWNFENIIDDKNRLVEVKQPCVTTITFHKDSLNQGNIRVSVRGVDIYSDGREIKGKERFVVFQVNQLPITASCSNVADAQVIKECIVKQSITDKEPNKSKPLGPLMLCLYSVEGKNNFLKHNQDAKTVFDQVTQVKQLILSGGAEWDSFPICLQR